MAWWKIQKDIDKNKSINTKSSKSKNKKVVSDDLKATKEIMLELKEIQKKVSTLKRVGRNNPKLNKLLDSISSESYKICLRC